MQNRDLREDDLADGIPGFVPRRYLADRCAVDFTDSWREVTTPETIGVMGCTQQKRELDSEETVPASELYDESDYFRKRPELAKLVCDDWYILSAEHGILTPDEEIGCYDTYLKELSTAEYESLNDDVWKSLRPGTIDVPIGAELVVLAGKDYGDLVDDALEAVDSWLYITTPLQTYPSEPGIGGQKAWLNAEIDRQRPTEQVCIQSLDD